MVEVPIRPPRFLGEKVPYREQTTLEKISAGLGSDFILTPTEYGYLATSKPTEYISKIDERTKIIKRGQSIQKNSYVAHEYTISPTGEVLTETTRAVRTKETGKTSHGAKMVTNEPYISSYTDYKNQTQKIYGLRDVRSGTTTDKEGNTSVDYNREVVSLKQQTTQGVVKEFNIVDQNADWEKTRRTPEQKELLRTQGFLVRKKEEYSVAGMNEQQREQYYRMKAKQRTAQYSLDAKAQQMARAETEKFRKGLSEDSQKYAMNLFEKQQEREVPSYTYSSSVQSSSNEPVFVGRTPTETTRTDMGNKMLFPIGGTLPDGKLVASEKNAFMKIKEAGVKKGGLVSVFSSVGVATEDPGKLQDIASYKSSQAGASNNPVSGYGYALAEFAISVPIGGVKAVKSVLPWNLPDTVGSMVNPESYRQLGVEFATRPAKTTGETIGAVATFWGAGKTLQVIKSEIASDKTQALSNTEKTGSSSSPDYQLRFGEHGGSNYVSNKAEMNFLKTKQGKGETSSTVFSSKTVMSEDGSVVSTPSIEKIGVEIPGRPSVLGKGFFGEEVTTSPQGVVSKRTVVETGGIKVATDIESTLVQPEIIATSKWLPGDVRPVTVKNGQPYVPDLFAPNIVRKFNPGEFTLSTVYDRGSVQTGQRFNILSSGSHQNLNYVKTFETPFGEVVVNTKSSPGVQQQLFPAVSQKITIIRNPGTYPPPAVRPSSSLVPQGSVVDMSSGSGGVIVQEVIPQTYATAGEVITGTLKVYPKYQITTNKVISKKSPSIMVVQETKPTTTSTVKPISFGEIGIVSLPKSSSEYSFGPSTVFKPSSSTVQKPEYVVQSSPKTEPSSIPDVWSVSKSKAESVVVLDPININVTRSENINRLDLYTETETELRTELQSRLNLQLTTDTTITTTPRTTITTTPRTTITTTPRTTNFPFSKESGKNKNEMFNVEVRKKGVFKKIATVSSPTEAFSIGQKNVMTTASASFRVTSSTGTVRNPAVPSNIFYQSKKESGVFIQRREKRISTAGEKREITFKGIQMNRNKNIFKR